MGNETKIGTIASRSNYLMVDHWAELADYLDSVAPGRPKEVWMLDNLADQSGACRLASSQGSTTLTKHCAEVFHPHVYMSPSYPSLATYPLLR